MISNGARTARFKKPAVLISSNRRRGTSSGLLCGPIHLKSSNALSWIRNKDPHSLNFDQGGVLWFTAQAANVMGQLDLRTGNIKIINSPTPNSRPYGLVINSRG